MSAEVGTKRKNDENAAPLAAKKPRGKAGKAATAQAVAADDPAASLVDAVLANPDAYPIPEKEDDVRASLVELASYARSLEQVIAEASKSAAAASAAIAQVAAPVKTPEQLEAEAAKIARAAQSGIKKQMKWKPTCKNGSARWVYDGICSDPAVFGVLMGLDGPPKFKMKKISVEEFEDLIGPCEVSARYDTMYITGKDVNIRWSDTGEFKFSGTYGRRV
ncbi:hypothetical protein PYCCODRAFT_1463207 [Trametes coccinea BRFM310]|uniref:Uncharacterized protein n=1 Tax=Trametes coccinea (strain BRFM310) TaxID=1353009 RepID=A0A1Y2J3F2_TRAC3|nr:hypothetical protein PYCCODRAFT_1463207 [Trametes coccinea BRFM310]